MRGLALNDGEQTSGTRIATTGGKVEESSDNRPHNIEKLLEPRRHKVGLAVVQRPTDNTTASPLLNALRTDSLERADFVKFAPGTTGTNCQNCSYQDGGLCTYHNRDEGIDLRGLKVYPDTCCGKWEQSGMERPRHLLPTGKTVETPVLEAVANHAGCQCQGKCRRCREEQEEREEMTTNRAAPTGDRLLLANRHAALAQAAYQQGKIALARIHNQAEASYRQVTNANPEGRNQYSGRNAARSASQDAHELTRELDNREAHKHALAALAAAREGRHADAAEHHWEAAVQHGNAPVGGYPARKHEEAMTAHVKAAQAHEALWKKAGSPPTGNTRTQRRTG